MPRARRLTLVAALLGLGSAMVPTACALIFTAQYGYLLEVKNRTEVPAQYTSMTFAEFLALPGFSAGYTDGDWEAVRTNTARAVNLEGYIAEVRQVRDGLNYGRLPWHGDIHLHLRERPQPRCFPDGPRREQLVTEVTPPFQPPKTGWSFETLLDLCEHQTRVRISGWLLHDYVHADGVGRWRASAWEIHPVTKIEVWNPAGPSWQPLP